MTDDTPSATLASPPAAAPLSEFLQWAQQSSQSSTKIYEVQESDEIARIEALPRRTEYVADAAALITRYYARDPERTATWAVCVWLCGGFETMPDDVMILRPAQAQPLCDLYDLGGAVAALKVGEGKTPVTLLAPEIVQSRCCVLLIPGGLRTKTEEHYTALQKAWRAKANHYIVSYHELALKQNAHLLDEIEAEAGCPIDLIAGDECQALRNPTNAATRRVARYAEKQSRAGRIVRMVLLSGTMFEGRGIRDYWHLLKWTLGAERMPLPSTPSEATQWSRALDPGHTEPLGLGALAKFVPPKSLDIVVSVQDWLGKRIRETPGVTITENPDSPAALIYTTWKPKLDSKIAAVLKSIESGLLPDGTELDSDEDQIRSMAQAPWGFYYKWKTQPPDEWRQARKEWWRFVRRVKAGGEYDTEFQIRNLAEHGKLGGPVPELIAWKAIEKSFKIETEVVWFSETILDQICQRYADEYLVWVGYRALGWALEKRGMPFYHQKGIARFRDGVPCADGPEKKFVEHCKRGRSIALSISACHKGLNLQYQWNKNAILAPIANNELIEQMIGRTHRQNQVRDTVEVEFALPIRYYDGALASAKSDARRHSRTTGTQKLNIGTWA